MGSKTTVKNDTSSTQTAAPPSWTLPGMQELAQRITDIIPTVPGPQYTGDFYASPNATQYASLPLYANASQQALQAGQQAQTAANTLGSFNPTFGTWTPQAYDTTNAIAAATQPIMQQLTQQILPGLQSDALSAGAYGNNRANEILPGLAIGQTMQNAQNIAAGINYSDFTRQQAEALQGYQAMTERGLGAGQLQLSALSQLPGMLGTAMQMNTGAADLLSQSGNMQQQWDQSAINNELAKFQYNLQYPFQGLDTATALLGQLSAGYGTTTGTSHGTQTTSSGGLAPILGGLVGLGGMIASGGASGGMGGLSSLFKPAASNIISSGTLPSMFPV